MELKGTNESRFGETLQLDLFDQEITNNAFDIICNTKDVISAVNLLLEQAGQYFHFDYVNVFEIISEDSKVRRTYFWSKQGEFVEHIEKFVTIEQFEEYVHFFNNEGILMLPNDRKELEEHCIVKWFKYSHITSVLQCLFYENDIIKGCISFECIYPRIWLQRDISSLLRITRVLSAYLLKLKLTEAMKEKLDYMKNYDTLTGLPMLNKFKRDVRRHLKRNPDREYAIVYSDINNFRYINESLGEEFADYMLVQFADLIRTNQENENCFARIEGDKFLSLVSYDSREKVLDFIYRRNELFRQKIKKKNSSINVVISSGVCPIRYGQDIPVAIDNANLARKSMKGNQQVPCRFFEQEMKDEIHKEIKISNIMEEALEKGEFLVYFQPKVALRDFSIVGAEALVRWKREDGTILSPADFIPVFEKNGFIVNLDFYVYEEVCKVLSRWREEKKKIVPISVNVSRLHLNDTNFIKDFKELIDLYGIPTSWIELELTESLFLDNTKAALSMMKELRSLGFCVSIDDFGAGYSSLNMLKDMTTDVIKLDKEFFRKGNMNREEKIIIKSIVGMAKQLDMKVLSEGIETENQSEFLREIHCDMAQGYLFSCPIPIDEFEKKLSVSTKL